MSRVLSNTDNPFPPPAAVFDDLDLSLAVNSYKPGRFELHDLPDMSPMYHRVKGRISRKPVRSRNRVVSMPPSDVSIKDLPPVPPKTRVVSEGGFSLHKEHEREKTRSPPPYTYEPISNKSLANQTQLIGSTEPPVAMSKNGTPLAFLKNRLSKFMQLETHADVTKNISVKTDVSRQNSTSRIVKPSRTKSVDKYRGLKEAHLKKFATPIQFNNYAPDVSIAQVLAKSSDGATQKKYIEPQQSLENVQYGTQSQASSASHSVSAMSKDSALCVDLDVSMNSLRLSYSGANKETSHKNPSELEQQFPDDNLSINSVEAKAIDTKAYKKDLTESAYIEFPECTDESKNANSMTLSQDKNIEISRNCSKEDTSVLGQLQTDSNAKEVDENQSDNLEYVTIDDLLVEYSQVYDTTVPHNAELIEHSKQESSSGNWESLPRSDASSLEGENSSSMELSANYITQPRELEIASCADNHSVVPNSREISGNELSPNLSRNIIVDDDEIDSLFSDVTSPQKPELEYHNPSSQFQSTISIPHSAISALNYIYDDLSVHDSMFSKTEEEDEYSKTSPRHEVGSTNSSSLKIKKLRGVRKHSSQPSSAQCSNDSRMTNTSSTPSMSMQDSMAKLKKYVQQRPYSFCLGDNKDYESSRYVSPNALAKPKVAGHFIDSSGEFDASIHSIPGEQSKRYFTTTGNLESSRNRDKNKVDKFVADKNLISLENILDNTMNNGKTRTNHEIPQSNNEPSNASVQTANGNNSNSQNRFTSDKSNFHHSYQFTHESLGDKLLVPGHFPTAPPKKPQLRFLLDPKVQTNSAEKHVQSDHGIFTDQLPHEPGSSCLPSLNNKDYIEKKTLPPIVLDNRRSISTDYLSYYSGKKLGKSRTNEKQRSSSAGKPTERTTVPLSKIQNSVRLLRNRISNENFGDSVPRLFSENLNVVSARHLLRGSDNEIETGFQPFPAS